jgi:hypothetical protein
MGIPAAGLNFSDGLPSSIISNAGIDGLCALTQNWALLGFLLIQIKVAHPVVCFELTVAFKSPNAAASQVNRLGHRKVSTPGGLFLCGD